MTPLTLSLAVPLSLHSRRELLDWYTKNQRDLPWRSRQDPYRILVSEMMLQQTQVATVIPFFERWMLVFPNFEALAQADIEKVLGCWQGLGYYRRARFLHQAARYVVAHGLPGPSAADWQKVPGVGRYTAGAVTSIAFGSPEPLVDGNVIRVVARVTADSSGRPTLEKRAWEWAMANLVKERPSDWNQALMELGATVCTPKSPKCEACPLKPECLASREESPTRFPVMQAKPTLIHMEQIAVIARFQSLFGLCQIPEGEWWAGMWQFPRFSSLDGAKRAAEFEGHAEYLGRVNHSVTHHRIRLQVYQARLLQKSPHLRWVAQDELEEIPLPSPQRKALKLLANPQPSLLGG